MSLGLSAGDGIAAITFAGCDLPAGDGGGGIRFEWDASGAPGADVLWLARRAEGSAAERVVAPSGEGLWRYAPWPAADALFDLDPPVEGGALVIGDGAAADLGATLEARGVAVARASRLRAAELESAAVVVLADEPDGPLPGEVPAVLAAGRVLVTTPRSPAFGFRPGVDHCQGKDPEALADLTESVLRHWDAFAAMRTHARIAAARHRASRVLRDLMTDLELGL